MSASNSCRTHTAGVRMTLSAQKKRKGCQRWRKQLSLHWQTYRWSKWLSPGWMCVFSLVCLDWWLDCPRVFVSTSPEVQQTQPVLLTCASLFPLFIPSTNRFTENFKTRGLDDMNKQDAVLKRWAPKCCIHCLFVMCLAYGKAFIPAKTNGKTVLVKYREVLFKPER